MDDLQMLQRTHPYGWSSIQIEHEKGRRDGDKGAGSKRCYTVGDGSHGVFANTKVNIAARIVAVDVAGGA